VKKRTPRRAQLDLPILPAVCAPDITRGPAVSKRPWEWGVMMNTRGPRLAPHSHPTRNMDGTPSKYYSVPCCGPSGAMPVEKLLDNTSLLLRCVILGAGPCTLAASFSLTWPLAPLSSVQPLYTLAA